MDKRKLENPLSRLMGLAGKQKKKYALSIVLAILGVAAGIIPYFAVARMLIALIGGTKEISFFVAYCLMAAAGYLLKVLFSIWSTSVSHTATFEVLKEIRKKLLSKLSRLPMGVILDTPSGRLKDTIVDRVEGLETTLAHMIPEISANMLIPVILLIYVFVLDWRMALVTLITLPLGMCFVMIMFRTYPAKYEGSVQASQQMNNAVVEYVNGIEVIKAFSQSAKSYQKYTDAVNYDASYFYNWMKSCQWPMSAYTAICPATLLTVLPIGFLFYAGGSLAMTDFITVIIISLGIIGPILAASNYMDSIAAMGTVVGEVCGILDKEELVRPMEEVELKDLTIEMNQVTFSYHADKKEILHGITLKIRPGTVTALVGPSGSGKSTIAKLIAGFWDVGGGEITLGGCDLKKIPQNQLADHIAYVSQDNYLFDDTVRENIRMGRKGATDAEVEQAARDAGCDEFIQELEQEYDTRVGSAGGHLSGGERQRIAIARAMLKNAPIVILDEATAYLDPENEAVLQTAIGKLVSGKTLIVIAHRLSTITDSDQIVVVKEGRIEDIGMHDELLHRSPLYQEMWNAHIGAKDGD